MIKDGYEEFFEHFKISHDGIIQFGIEKIMFCKTELAITEWAKLKKSIHENEKVFIRGYGRDAKGTELFVELYKLLLGNNKISKDATNNYNPTKLIQEWTNFSKNSQSKSNDKNIIKNYQVSHIFGRTKNPYLFNAPFNIIFIPKICDPFTGHEASGPIAINFSKKLKEMAIKEFKTLIQDYNSIVSTDEFKANLDKALDQIVADTRFSSQNLTKFKNDALLELSEILIEN